MKFIPLQFRSLENLVSISVLISLLVILLEPIQAGKLADAGANQIPITTTSSPYEAATESQSEAIFLESIEDLEHVAYLSLRNFNLTDENLEQSNPSYRNADRGGQESLLEARNLEEGGRQRLALMLESFIYHLRRDHLRRIELGELVALAKSMNLGATYDLKETDSIQTKSESSRQGTEAEMQNSSQNDSQYVVGNMGKAQTEPPGDRCHYLVQMYRHELESRERQAAVSNWQEPLTTTFSNKLINGSSYEMASKNNDSPIGSSISIAIPNTKRLMRLCRLVVDCQTAEDFLNIITDTWRDESERLTSTSVSSSPISEPLIAHGELEVESEADVRDNQGQTFSPATQRQDHQQHSKSLRESLSRSLAKLCPLILFQLHDSEGHCTANRDDRPPMIAVWAFATLFVTIVSFCSLIGLSITPLLGHSATGVDDESRSDLSETGSSSTSSGCSAAGSLDQRPQSTWCPGVRWRKTNNTHEDQKAAGATKESGRACLTMFEGLAVGSLVGSGLFSLIPQAFELQERESNQGFLLKALIIFFGIYLFFLSERIMRIILDTRQQRKRLKQSNRRPSTSVPLQASLISSTGAAVAPNQLSVHFSCLTAAASNQRSATRDRLNWRSQGVPSIEAAPWPGHGQVGGVDEPRDELSSREARRRLRLARAGSNCNQEATSNSQTSSISKSINRDMQSKQHLPGRRSRARRPRPLRKKKSSGEKNNKEPIDKSLSISRHHQAQISFNGRQQGSATRYLQDGNFEPEPQQHGRVDLMLNQLDAEGESSSFTTPKHRPNSSTGRHDSRSDSEWTGDESHEAPGATKCNLILARPTTRSQNNRNNFINTTNNQESLSHRSTFYPSEWAVVEEQQKLQIYNNKNDRDQLQQIHLMQCNNNHNLHSVTGYLTCVVEQDISTVAWMIVLGDGLHNFIDGISIGAAFSESILSGVSISVAVICEEFPHELGDFAVLVSSGMTVRQALGYNFLSACTCYLGMAFGIILGDVDGGASYISALAAGVFLYIALVDMMGELSATLEKSSRGSLAKTLNLLLLQNIGIFIGISIIFVLSYLDF